MTSRQQYGSVVRPVEAADAAIALSAGVTDHSMTAPSAREDIRRFLQIQLGEL